MATARKYPLTTYIYASQYKSGEHWHETRKHLLFSFALSDAKRYPNWRVVRLADNVTLAAKYTCIEMVCDSEPITGNAPTIHQVLDDDSATDDNPVTS
jgi:hypothetical protein